MLYLNFVTTLLGNFNIDANGDELTELTPIKFRLPDIRVKIATNEKVGIPWISKLVQVRDKSIQLQTLKLLIQLMTSCKTREIIRTNNIHIMSSLNKTLGNEDLKIIKHFQHYITKYTELLSFPYEALEQKTPEKEEKEKGKEQEQDQEQDQEQEQDQQTSLPPTTQQSSLAMRRNRRVRHKALKLTQDQVEAISDGSSPQDNTPSRVKALKNFVINERKYISILTKALWMYFKPLYGLPPNPPKGLISSNVLRNIFSPLEHITVICSTFVDIIENRLL